jgi:hypothetical protein
MTTLRQAAQQVLEACTDAVVGWQSLAPLSVRRAAMDSLDALRAALAQEEPRRTGLPHCERSCEAQAFQIEIRRLKAAMENKP